MNPRHKLFQILRMSALRQAMLLTALFVAVLTIAGVFAILELNREFDKRIRSELRSGFTAVAAEIAGKNPVQTYAPALGLDMVHFTPSDQQIPKRLNHADGFFERSDDDDPFGRRPSAWNNGKWLYFAGPVEEGHLVVGVNLWHRDEFEEITLQTLVGVGVLSAIVALIFGIWLGVYNQRRITAISSVLNKVASGDLTARVAPLRNSDDMDDLARRVDDTTAQLDRLMRQARGFSANIAHDLKTPLTRLRIRLETALTAEADDGDSLEQIGAALEQADKVIAIFDAFLRIAKLESGASKTNFTTVALQDIVEDITDAYGPVIEDSGRVLRIDLDPNAQITGDRVLLIQMLANMIENALRHTPEGSPLRLVANTRELGLADQGPGIAPEHYEKVVQPLYRLEKSRTTEGAGLGLALVKTIADLHGASLRLSPDPETVKGLYIRCILPANAKLTRL